MTVVPVLHNLQADNLKHYSIQLVMVVFQHRSFVPEFGFAMKTTLFSTLKKQVLMFIFLLNWNVDVYSSVVLNWNIYGLINPFLKEEKEHHISSNNILWSGKFQIHLSKSVYVKHYCLL